MGTKQPIKDSAQTETIKIYERTYELPVLSSPRFMNLQTDIQVRQQLIKEGKREQTKWFGLIRKTQQLNFEERFSELERLVSDYNRLIGLLKKHKDSYQQFFVQLTDELKGIVAQKCHQLFQKEQKRQKLENRIRSDELRDTLKNQKQQILRTVFLLGKASLLMLKKVDLISQGINKLAEDQDWQRQVLGHMVERLNEYKEVYDLQKEIDKLEKETLRLAQVAVNFEDYLSPLLGSFQGLLDQVIKIDSQLSGTVEEIKFLVQDILSSESGLFPISGPEELSDNLLNFLVTSNEKKERLSVVLSQAQSTGWSFDNFEFPDDCVELTTAIDSIQTHVATHLTQLCEQVLKIDVVTVNAEGREVKTEKGQAQYFTKDLGNGVNLEMVYIPGGTFTMGSPPEEKGSLDSERPQHQVTVQPFFMGKFQVTQAQWRDIAALPKVNCDLKPDPSRFKGDDHPVENVSWYDAIEFCARLSKMTGRDYRLPSEAEWEYACRAGTATPFHFGETITTDLANYDGNKTTSVGSFPPNAFGLYDMHGNVFEWCSDNWHDNYQGAPTDGSAWTGAENDNLSPMRGGSWGTYPQYCRSASRVSNLLRDGRFSDYGFRVVCGSGRTQ